MGIFSSYRAAFQINKAWERNKEAISGRLAPRGGDLGKAYRNVRGQTADVATNVTEEAGRHGVDKPGEGTILKHYWDQGVNIVETALGNRGGRNDRSSSSGTDDINEPDTRATLAGRRNRLDEYSTANRRGVSVAMKNPNKGKKHSILTQRKGGR